MVIDRSSEKLDGLFVALADRNRRAMLDQLSLGPRSVTEMAVPLNIALPSAVKHLAVLENGGLVRSKKTGRVRTYEMTPDAFGVLEAWVRQRKAQWSRQFDGLERYLEEGGT